MTFFLDGPAQIPRPKVNQPDEGVSSFVRGLGAAFNVAQIENDANFRINRETRREAASLARQALPRLSGVEEEFRARGVSTEGVSPDEIVGSNPKAAAVVLELARAASQADPENWQDLALTDEAIYDAVNSRLRAEWEDGQEILSMMPGGRAAAELMGGIGGITADVKNVPFLLMGGGTGSFLRIMGREALINAGAEAAFMPAQFDASERLDIADPNVVEQLALAATGGAVLGGVIEGVARGIGAFQGRSTPEAIPGYTSAESEALIQATEDALEAGTDPVAAGRSVVPTQDVTVALPNSVRAEIAENAIGRSGINENLAVLQRSAPLRVEDIELAQTATRITPNRQFATPFLDTRQAEESAVRYAAARRSNPQVFDQLERSQRRTETLRGWIEDFEQQQTSEVGEMLAALDRREAALTEELTSPGPKPRGKRRIRDDLKKVRAAREEAMELSEAVETPDMQRVRRQMMEEDAKQRSLAPEIGRAYRETAEEADAVIADLPTREPQQLPLTEIEGLEVEGSVTTAADPQITTAYEVFDDALTPEAEALQRNMAADFRDDIERDGDFMVDMGDGKGERPASSVLDEIEEGEQFAEALNLCGAPRRES